MKTLLILTVLISAALCAERILREATAEELKAQASWKSYDWKDNPFRDYTDEQIKNLLGVNLRWDQSNVHLLIDDDDHSRVNDLPREYDFRAQWPQCAGPIRNQQQCGSCWAFSGAEAVEQRLCMASQGKINLLLSPQDSVSCDHDNYACMGGYLDRTWNYYENYGLVTEQCFPYVSGDGSVPSCPAGACVDNRVPYVKYRIQLGTSRPFTCPAQIKEELVANGPLQTGFIVYEDFMHYQSGVYVHTHGGQLGGHAVVILGWGVEADGHEFWIVQNSWGPNWGEAGYFRIRFGQCMFDQNGYAGLPRLTDFAPNFLFWHDY